VVECLGIFENTKALAEIIDENWNFTKLGLPVSALNTEESHIPCILCRVLHFKQQVKVQ